jgi:zinc transporter, ZIP family
MRDLLVLVVAGTGTALATGLGAIPVFLLGDRAIALRPALWGFAAGAMGVASLLGLLVPALDEGSPASVAGGLAVGIAFVLGGRRFLATPHERADALLDRRLNRASVLVFVVLLVHSLPEGFAIGSAYASSTAGLGLFVIIAIAVQNVPEGTTMAIPMAAAGASRARQFWTAVVTSLPQPVGALVAYALVEQVSSLLAVSFAFAAGAMVTLVVAELLPRAYTRGTWRSAAGGTIAGGLLLLLLSLVLGV